MNERSAKWFAIAAAIAGVAAGFRLTLPLIMAPLFLWVAIKIRLRFVAAIIALLCSLAGVATWLPILISATGGLQQYIELTRGYSQEQLGSTSVLYGAAFTEWLTMGGKALMWSCLGTLSWVWAVPIAFRKEQPRPSGKASILFLCCWFVPGLLVYATLHAADPDHTLAIVPATCIAGAMVLARAATRRGSVLIVGAAVLLNVFLFVKPISKSTKAATYRPVQWLDNYVRNVVEGSRMLQRNGPLVVVVHHDSPGWRQLSYYVPEAHIITVTLNEAGQTVAVHQQGARVHREVSREPLVKLPRCAAVAWADPFVAPERVGGAPVPALRGGIYSAACTPGQAFVFRQVQFVVEDAPKYRISSMLSP